MKKKQKPVTGKPEATVDRWRQSVFWSSVALLVLIPLAFSTSVRLVFTLPKFVLLLLGTALLLLLLVQVLFGPHRVLQFLKFKQVTMVGLYFFIVTLSTAFGVAPVVSFVGTNSFIGWLTRIGFFVCFIGLIVGIGDSPKRLRLTLWAIAATGGVAALYGLAQFLGGDPWLPRSIYTFRSSAGTVIRVSSSLGHSNYLANFLLYTTPLSLGLGLASKGLSRALAFALALLSLVAIVISGVRGAWVGILAAALALAFLAWKSAAKGAIVRNKPLLWRAGLGLAAVCLVTFMVLLFSPAAHSVFERVQSLRKEGLASSGRLILWRDAVKMVPAYALIGCGPEGFRQAFLAYKSKELAQLSPTQNNESSHNAYLDNVISYGLAGGLLYLMMIGSTLLLLARLYGQAQSVTWRVLIASLIGSFAAALTHNFFIYNQLPTGLYLFAFLALALASANCMNRDAAAATSSEPPAQDLRRQIQPNHFSPARVALSLVTGVILLVALWYSTGLLKADAAASTLLTPAIVNNFAALQQQGERVTASPNPTGANDYLFARALDTFVRNRYAQGAVAQEGGKAAAVKQQALQLAINHAERSLAHTLTPDMNYSLLASLALLAGDIDKLEMAAREAVRYDPNNYYARSLMAEAYLARGQREQAVQEAELALEIYHISEEAAFVLARARDGSANSYAAAELAAAEQRSLKAKRSIQELTQIAHNLAQTGKLKKARLKLLSALASTDNRCADCHRELALIYEKQGNIGEAIVHWDSFIEQATDPAAVAQAKERVQGLKQGSSPKP